MQNTVLSTSTFNGKKSVVIGTHCSVGHDDCLLIGDGLQSKSNCDFVIGDTCFGDTVPEHIRQQLLNCPDGLRWLMDKLQKAIGTK